MSENEVVVHDLGGVGPALLFMHATGFHGRSYTHLATRLQRFHCFGIDFNGHGDASLMPNRLNPIAMAHAAAAAIVKHGLQGCFAFGHSMGGSVAPLLESLYPGTFSAIFLYDPTFPSLTDQEDYYRNSSMTSDLLQGLVRNRRNRFDSLEAAVQSLKKKPPFATFHPEALDAYLTHGVRPSDDGQGVQLKCLPSTEVAIFEAWRRPPSPDLSNIRCPVFVATATPDDSPHRFLPIYGSHIPSYVPCGQHQRLEPLTHFGPMEDPERVSKVMDNFFDDVLSGRVWEQQQRPARRSAGALRHPHPSKL